MAVCVKCGNSVGYFSISSSGLCSECLKIEKESSKEKELSIKDSVQKNSNVIITTGHNIEGYRIQEYHGIIYSKQTFSDLFFYQEKLKQEGSFNEELAKASEKLKKMAKDKGANAVIGVSTEFYNTGSAALGQKLMICILSGTAVTVITEQ